MEMPLPSQHCPALPEARRYYLQFLSQPVPHNKRQETFHRVWRPEDTTCGSTGISTMTHGHRMVSCRHCSSHANEAAGDGRMLCWPYCAKLPTADRGEVASSTPHTNAVLCSLYYCFCRKSCTLIFCTKRK